MPNRRISIDLDRLNLLRREPKPDPALVYWQRGLTLFEQIHGEGAGDRLIEPNGDFCSVLSGVEQADDRAGASLRLLERAQRDIAGMALEAKERLRERPGSGANAG